MNEEWKGTADKVSQTFDTRVDPVSFAGDTTSFDGPVRRPDRWVVNIEVSCASPRRFALRLRKPEWLSAPAVVTVNGERMQLSSGTGERARLSSDNREREHLSPDSSEAGHLALDRSQTERLAVDSQGFVLLDRMWHTDRVVIELPTALRAEPIPDEPDTVAFLDGPIVLAGLSDREVALYGDRGNLSGFIVPDNEQDLRRSHLAYRTVRQPWSIRFIPLYEVVDEAYTVCFPVQASAYSSR